MQDLGERLRDSTWKPRLLIAVSAAIATAAQAPEWSRPGGVLHSLAGENSILLATAIGAVAGWYFLSILGILMAATAYVVALSLVLLVIAVILGLIYLVLAEWLRWPPAG